MTAAGHRGYGELAAAYTLHALDPADEQRFLTHAASCPACQQLITGFTAVTAALADTAPPAQPSPQLAQRILAATQPGSDPAVAGAPAAQLTTEPEAGLPPGVVRLRRGPGRRTRWLTAAAAAVIVIAGGTWGGLAATSGSAPAPLAMCARPHHCSEVTLVAAKSHQVAGKVVVAGHQVWMVPTAMAANPAGEIYVLWQITGARAPVAVGSFDVRPGGHAPIQIGGLTAPFSGTKTFAVSLEHGKTIPAAPSAVLAQGQVS